MLAHLILAACALFVFVLSLPLVGGIEMRP
jgi:hypothetical protein